MGLGSRDVAIACIGAFLSWTLLTHLLPSLRWIPYAFLAGVLATALGLLYVLLTTSRGVHYGRKRRRQYVPPAFLRPGQWQQEKEDLKARSSYQKTAIFPRSKKVSRSIDTLLDLIVRDFVTGWYVNISKRPLFQNEVDRAIRESLGNIRDRVSSLDYVEFGISRVTPIITTHMRDFYNAERTVRGKNLSRTMTESEELDLAIAGKYKDGRLHKAADLTFSDTKLMQQVHLRKTTARLLPYVFSESMQTSPAVTTLIREIVACAVLGPIMQMLTDPDMWNQLLEGYGRTLLQDRKTVRKLRAALDERAPASPANAKPAQFPRLRPGDNERQFERFIRAIRHCSTLSDARRFRSEITSQIRRASSVEVQDPVYQRRLEAGRRILDQKIAYLAAGGTSKPKLRLRPTTTASEVSAKLQQATLKEVMHNASGLSYFMEYMDRRNRMRMVQFWIVVDGFRNPLEEDTDEPELLGTGGPAWSHADRMDIAQINDAYLSKPEINASSSSQQAVEEFLKAGHKADAELYLGARRAILQAQTAVFEEMREKYFEGFRKSDLFYKWLATEEGSILSATSEPAEAKSPSRSLDYTRDSSPKLSRTNSSGARVRVKEPELRRTVMSSTDLNASARPTLSPSTSRASLDLSRKSFDDSGVRPALFDDDIDDERLTRSVPTLGTESDGELDADVQEVNTHVVNDMQTALNKIMADEPDKDSLFASEPSIRSSTFNDSPRNSVDLLRPPMLHQKSKPSIASLGLVGAPSSTGVFTDDLFGDEEKFLEDEREDADINEKAPEDDIHEAAPGDLGLAEAIDALNAEIQRLTAQEAIVDSLTKKAELTNNAAELRILKKSKQSLQREIHRKEMQKQQYVIQESDNSLYGRAAINIKSIMVGKEEDGHEYALYVIEVRRQAGDQMPAATWAVTRRYSEFHELHKRLRARFPAVRDLEFPRRQTLFTLQKDFLQKRRVVLEKYLRSLLLVPAICRSRELRAFLSQAAISSTNPNQTQVDTRDFVTRIYNSVSDGMEEFLGNIPVLDQLTVAGQNLISAATTQMNGVPLAANGGVNGPINAPEAAETEAEINAFEDRELEPFVKPICDLFLEAFELQKGNSWLRGRAVVVVLHQLLGGTIERKVRDAAKGLVAEDSLARYIDTLKESMWPGGKMKQAGTPRSVQDKARSRQEAGLLLATLVPDLAGSVVGRANAQAAGRKIFAMLNNQRLNTHLVFTLFDEIVQIIFPEVIGR